MKFIPVVMAAGVALSAAAGPVEDSARKILTDFGASVVPITAVLKIEAPGASAAQERPIEFLGTVMAPNGLTVVSATTLSPLNNTGDAASVGGVRPTVTATRIRIRLADGIEVAARQVLTDEDLDVTFLLPEIEEGKRAPVFPSPVPFARGAEAAVADEVFTVGLSGDLFNWMPVIGRLQVLGRVERPRRLYLIAGAYTAGVGAPVFLTDGRPLGLLVVRREPVTPRPDRPAPFQQAVVVLPADEVVELAEQALKKGSSAPTP